MEQTQIFKVRMCFAFKWPWHSNILQGGFWGTAYKAAEAYNYHDIMELLKNYKPELSSA
jgi:hypothetical protein